VYLAEEAADDVLRFVAALPSGSEIVLTFAPRRLADHDTATAAGPMAAAVAELGEPWRTFIDPPELEEKLRRFGFTDITVLSPEDAEARYFRGRADGLPPPRRSSVAAAIV
jgi:O-methyltransferase involved in polyketide biosynthesis